jgi:hypothetical protein
VLETDGVHIDIRVVVLEHEVHLLVDLKPNSKAAIYKEEHLIPLLVFVDNNYFLFLPSGLQHSDELVHKSGIDIICPLVAVVFLVSLDLLQVKQVFEGF